MVPARQVAADREFGATRAAQDGFPAPLALRPNLDFVISQRSVAIFAGVVNAAAFHFDGDDVDGLVEVCATSLGIDIDPAHLWSVVVHIGPGSC